MKQNKIELKKNSIAIVGWHDGSAGQIDAWFEKSKEYDVVCFINPNDRPLDIYPKKIQRDASQFSYPTKTTLKGKPLINSLRWDNVIKKHGIEKVLVTTDDMHDRYSQIIQAKKAGLKLINAIHPTACIMEGAILKENIILYPKAYVGYRAELFTGAIMNTGSQIDHHCVLKECATIDPGVVFASNVTVGKFTRVHTGAICKNRIRMGENSVIGAGSVIIEDVPDNVTVVGVPGKIIKRSAAIKLRQKPF